MFDRWGKLVQAEKERQREKVQKSCTNSIGKVKKPRKNRE